ncbi:MAG: glycosyltransferase, partial [Candidatus Acidiferrum sp.]
MPELGSTSELLSGVAAKLAERGFRVRAIAGQPNYFGKARVDKVLELNGVIVRRVFSTQLDKNTAFGRALNAATLAVSMFLSLLFVERRSLIVAVTTPPLLPWVCYAAHRLAGSRYVVLIFDVYPDIAVALGAVKKGGLIARMWHRLNALSLDAAERIVVLGRDMEELINQRVSAHSRDKITTVPNWADGEMLAPIDRSTHPVLAELRALDRFVVLYSGNIGRFHEIST